MESNEAKLRIILPEKLSANPGPSENFTGTVMLTPLLKGEEPSCLTCEYTGS